MSTKKKDYFFKYRKKAIFARKKVLNGESAFAIILIYKSPRLSGRRRYGDNMEKYNIGITNRRTGKIDDKLFSSFLEQMGRAVYGGVYQPENMQADENGLRKDVIGCVKESGVKYVRYPGGNFVSGYDWKAGIGLKNQRKAVKENAWKEIEPNTFGVDEFMDWAKKCGIEPIMAVNLGLGTPEEAAELVEYCNATVGYWAEKRKENGHAEPYNVKYWCMGNEMDGEWQIGHKTMEGYAAIANKAAELMKAVDPTIKLIFCGSSTFDMPTFPEWDKYVVDNCFEHIDYLSCHSYYRYDRKPENVGKFMESCDDFDRGITKVENIIKEIKAKHKSDKQIKISCDEWNVWYMGEGTDKDSEWVVGPRREENVLSSLDATVVASLMCVLINHCDTVEISCIAQLINVIPLILTDENRAIKATIFYPFKYISQNMKGDVFECEIDKNDSKTISAFSYDESNGIGCLTVCNLSGNEITINADLSGLPLKPCKVISMAGNEGEKNDFENPFRVLPKERAVDGDITLDAYSWNVVIFGK